MAVLRVICGWLTLAGAPVWAATLQQMSLQEMVHESTSIVRGEAGGSRTVRDGALIYTLTCFKVLEHWKGETSQDIEIALPGGKFGNFTQRFAGVPRLELGPEWIVFLWRGPSGRTQIIGLSQGLFQVQRSAYGEVLVSRKPNADLLLAPGSGTLVHSPAIQMPLREFAARVQAVLASESTTR